MGAEFEPLVGFGVPVMLGELDLAGFPGVLELEEAAVFLGAVGAEDGHLGVAEAKGIGVLGALGGLVAADGVEIGVGEAAEVEAWDAAAAAGAAGAGHKEDEEGNDGADEEAEEEPASGAAAALAGGPGDGDAEDGAGNKGNNQEVHGSGVQFNFYPCRAAWLRIIVAACANISS